MAPSFDISFPNGNTATAIRVEAGVDLDSVLHSLGLDGARPVLVVVGGAGKLNDDDRARVRSLFVRVLAPLAQTLNAVVVDGGTDAGVMQMMGRARRKTNSTFPLIGVAPIGTAGLPGQPLPHSDGAFLEPHHTHFVLVPGDYWGDESIWIAQIASAIANDLPSVTVLINGGEATWNDASQNVQEGRPLLVIAGSGRTADALATALDGKVTDERARRIVESGLLKSIDLRSSDDLARVIRETLSR